MLYATLLDVFSDSSQPLEASADAIKLWSKFHLSPGGTTAMRRPDFIAAKATALQFLKHPVKVGVAKFIKHTSLRQLTLTQC